MGLVWMVISLRMVELVVKNGISVWFFLQSSIFLIPSLLYTTTSFTFPLAILIAYARLNRDNELVILKTSGLSNRQLAKPVIILALFATLMQYSISLYFLPKSYKSFREFKMSFNNNYISLLLQEGVFNTQIKGLSVYIKNKKDNEFFGVLVHDQRKIGEKVTFIAQKASVSQGSNGINIELYNGSRQAIDDKNRLSVLYFDNYKLALNLSPHQFYNISTDPNELTINKLFSYPKDHPDESDSIKRTFIIRGHQRLSWPLFALALGVFVAAFYLRYIALKKARVKYITILSIIFIGSLVLNDAISNFAITMPKLIIMVYLIPVVLLLYGVMLLRDKYN